MPKRFNSTIETRTPLRRKKGVVFPSSRRTALRKQGKGKISTLKRKLWAIFALYIKERDQWICFTCGRYARSYGMGAGHYIAKAACSAVYYFHEKNVHAQCTYCNLTLEGNRPVYKEKLLARYGPEAVRDIEQNFTRPTPDYPYEAKIAEYKEKLQALTK